MRGLRLILALMNLVGIRAVAAEQASPATTTTADAGGSPKTTWASGETLVGVAMEWKDWGPARPHEAVVRVAFHRTSSGWKAFPDPAPYPFKAELADLPRHIAWTTCRSGRAVGSFQTNLVPNRSYALGGLHLPTAPDSVPFSGDRTFQFAGWLSEAVHRPIVTVSAGHCADPDEWREAPVEKKTLKALLRAVRTVARVLQCDERARWVPWAYQDSDVRVRQAYRSRQGDVLAVLQVLDAPQASKDCDGIGGPAEDPQLFHVSRSGAVRHLGASLQVLDFGDYDGDGRSEVVTMVQRYNRDGFVLFFDGLRESATFAWGYH